LTDDGRGIAEIVQQAICMAGGKSTIIERTALADHRAVDQAVAAARAANGPVSGVIHLAPLAGAPLPQRLEDWRLACAVDVKSLYRVLHEVGSDLKSAGERGAGYVLTASSLDGHFGRGASDMMSPSHGGALGLIKTAAAEWPGVCVRGIDFDRAMTAKEVAELVIGELRVRSGDVEVGYADGRRTAFHTVASPWPAGLAGPVQPNGDWVVLVSGGARGITAAVAQRIARPGMRVVVVGRSPNPGEESADTRGATDQAALRRALIARLGSEPGKVAPIEIDRAVGRVLADREIRDNLARLEAAGAKVEYHAADLRDENHVGQILDGVYRRHGRLDAVIHGAGVIADKLIVDKTPESFDSVFDTKADSAFLLGRLLRPQGLKLLVLFGSVAGRFGNVGQGDYAAANEVVNRMAWLLHRRWPETRVVSINWGPWNSPGMASDAVLTQFLTRGIVPIEMQDGGDYLVNELALGQRNDVELIVGQGPWGQAGSSPAASAESAKPASRSSLFVASPRMRPDGAVAVEEVFDLTAHPFLGDHVLDGIPVLPATAALEWLAQLAQTAWPDLSVHEVRDLRVLKGFRLEAGAKRGLIRARASSHADAESLKISIDLSDPASGVPYYRGFATLVPKLPEPPRTMLAPISGGKSLDREAAYREHLFHGRRFQLIASIEQIGPEGIEATVAPSDPAFWLADRPVGGWLFDPGVLDTSPQLAIVWSRLMRGITPLPSHFNVVSRYDGAPPSAGVFRVRLRVRPGGAEELLVYDSEIFDQNGRVYVRMEGIESVGYAALNRLGAAQ
jgi:NAD(P)-dependent dehydrogenase (short-subunit alcohol dehydrogenase family)